MDAELEQLERDIRVVLTKSERSFADCWYVLQGLQDEYRKAAYRARLRVDTDKLSEYPQRPETKD